MAALAAVAGILTLGRRNWLGIASAAALSASLVVLVGLIWLHESDHGNGPSARATAAAMAGISSTPEWQWRRISQAMARKVDFRGADLDGANLDGLQLSHVDFDGAQADDASFRGSQLQGASLRGASLRGACLEGADLTGADLTGADLTGADVAGATVSPQAEKAALAWPSGRAAPVASCT
jgi:uncharacterized protein YjbI with pentapeptide repeats